jgi:hypothetical protein
MKKLSELKSTKDVNVIYYRPNDLDKIRFWGRTSRSKQNLKKYNEKQGKANFSTLVKTAENWQRIVDRYESPEEQYINSTQGK